MLVGWKAVLKAVEKVDVWVEKMGWKKVDK
jgi:hypothetical protein